MKYISLTFLILLLCQSAFSQSKKEQIETLIFQKDSLGRVLEKERQLNSDQVKQLETKISKINSDMALIQMELDQSKKELEEKEDEISSNQVELASRENTIRSLREDLGNYKALNLEHLTKQSLLTDSVRILKSELAALKNEYIKLKESSSYDYFTFKLCEAEFDWCKSTAIIQIKKGEKMGIGTFVNVKFKYYHGGEGGEMQGYILKHKNGKLYILKDKADIYNDEIGVHNGDYEIRIAESQIWTF
jgi:hypothetical protein